MPKKQTSAAEGFLGSVFKYSISTFVNIAILALSMLLTGLFIPSNVHNQISLFTGWTQSIMTIAILGLDQALIRFYYERPAGLTQNGLFRLCFYFSSAVLVLAGAVCSTLLLAPVYNAIGFSMVGPGVVPLLFMNALFYMVARYFNVLYRMEANIAVYTAESILMQFFYKLFYILGAFLGFANPVPAMVICSVAGMGGFALVFSFLRRHALRPRAAEFKSGAWRTLLPYGLAVAPTAVMVTMNYNVAQSYLTGAIGEELTGVYAYAYTLSNAVTLIQGGFASFWGPYMFENYKTQQPRIKRVHNYLNLVVLVFFALLVAFEDIIFFILRRYAGAQPIFPLMMLSAVFTILCETTVYGNAIARRPIFDTIGIGISFAVNIAGCVLLVPHLGLHGAALVLALANGLMFLFRTFTAQRLYSSIQNPAQTIVAVLLALAVTAAGTVFAHQFVYKLAACAVAAALYCLLYRRELVHLVKLGLSMLAGLFRRGKT